MAYRKYDTCFFERYAILSLQTLLGHKFDGLVNEDRPDLQSEDGRRLGIEVTRAMEEGRGAAQQMLKDLSGISAEKVADLPEYRSMIDNGYGYGLQDGRYVGGLEFDYWTKALPLKQIIANKVNKVASGFYGEFSEYGLYVFSKDHMTEWNATEAMRYTRSLQRDNDVRYARLYLFCVDRFYAINLEDGISDEYRISDYEVSREQRREFYVNSLDYTDKK